MCGEWRRGGGQEGDTRLYAVLVLQENTMKGFRYEAPPAAELSTRRGQIPQVN